MIDINHIYNEDCESGLKNIPDNSIDIHINSPPYKDFDGYNFDKLWRIQEQIYRTLKNNSLYFLNFGHLNEEKFRPFGISAQAISLGFKLKDTIIWIKNHFTPIRGNKTLNNLTEFIFMYYKGEMPDLDRLSIGIPYKDKSNAKRFNNGVDLRCAGNVWYINYETIQNSTEKPHKDGFPLELPEKCIKLSGLPKNSLVCDCFSGSATTALAARKLGMNYIGFEKNIDYWNIGNKRLQECQSLLSI